MRLMLLLLTGALLSPQAPFLAAQENKESPNNPFRELIEKMTPEARLKYERLRKAEFASLELARRPLDFGENPERLKEPYQEGDRIYFRLLITNNSIEAVTFARVDRYQEQRPELSRDSDPVPYQRKTSELLVQKDRAIMGRRVNDVYLQAGQTTEEIVDLAAWYSSLQPGHYQLKVRRRFIFGGVWVESPAITFEVDSKRASGNQESKHGDL